MKIKLLVLLLVAMGTAGLSGCSSSSSYVDTPYPPTPLSKEIDVISEASIPAQKYTIIGEVEGYDIRGLKKQARKLGADAIFIPHIVPGSFGGLQSSAVKYKS
jgi:hypothetical protein